MPPYIEKFLSNTYLLPGTQQVWITWDGIGIVKETGKGDHGGKQKKA